jgi:hypothetical protein
VAGVEVDKVREKGCMLGKRKENMLYLHPTKMEDTTGSESIVEARGSMSKSRATNRCYCKHCNLEAKGDDILKNHKQTQTKQKITKPPVMETRETAYPLMVPGHGWTVSLVLGHQGVVYGVIETKKVPLYRREDMACQQCGCSWLYMGEKCVSCSSCYFDHHTQFKKIVNEVETQRAKIKEEKQRVENKLRKRVVMVAHEKKTLQRERELVESLGTSDEEEVTDTTLLHPAAAVEDTAWKYAAEVKMTSLKQKTLKSFQYPQIKQNPEIMEVTGVNFSNKKDEAEEITAVHATEEPKATVDPTEINDPAKVAEDAAEETVHEEADLPIHPAEETITPKATCDVREDTTLDDTGVIPREVMALAVKDSVKVAEEDIVTLAGDVTIPMLFPGGITLTVKGIVLSAQEKLTILWVAKTVNQSQDAILSFYDWSKRNWPIKIQMVALVI